MHETTCCRVMLSCPLRCGESDLFRSELPTHMKELCVRRRMRCPLECTLVGNHKLLDCDGILAFGLVRVRLCFQCGSLRDVRVQVIPFCDLETHVRDLCQFTRITCEYGCGKELVRGEWSSHSTNFCAMRR
jgi:hypothetical protein